MGGSTNGREHPQQRERQQGQRPRDGNMPVSWRISEEASITGERLQVRRDCGAIARTLAFTLSEQAVNPPGGGF